MQLRLVHTAYLCRCIVIKLLVCWPPFMDVTKPDELGLTGVRNFYLDVDEEITIGAW